MNKKGPRLRKLRKIFSNHNYHRLRQRNRANKVGVRQAKKVKNHWYGVTSYKAVRYQFVKIQASVLELPFQKRAQVREGKTELPVEFKCR